jgi:hypothetical protein
MTINGLCRKYNSQITIYYDILLFSDDFQQQYNGHALIVFVLSNPCALVDMQLPPTPTWSK